MSRSSNKKIDIEQILISNSEKDTIRIGQIIAEKLGPGSIVALFGDLGSGKTRIVQGVCLQLAVNEEVTSPTFTLINEYKGTLPVYHFDFYRIDNESEIWQLGYEEYLFGDGVSLIEWADKMKHLLPENCIKIYLKSSFLAGRENQREIKIIGMNSEISI